MTARVVELVGEVDLATAPALAERLADARTAGQHVVVDLGDCTFVDLQTVSVLVDAYRASKSIGLGFAIVVPPSASAAVRFLLLDVAPELAQYPVYPSLALARTGLARGVRTTVPVDASRVQAARSETWRLLREQAELLAQRDELVLETRAARSRARRGDGVS